MVVRLPGRPQRRPPHRRGRRGLRPPARAERDPLRPHHPRHRQRRRGRPRRPAGRARHAGRQGRRHQPTASSAGNAHLIMPYHQRAGPADRALPAGRTRWARPSAASVRPTPTRRPGSACGSRTCFDPKIFRQKLDVALKEKNADPGQGVQPPAAVGRRRSAQHYLDEFAPRSARWSRRHRRAVLHDAWTRAQRPARGRPGHLPRPRPRDLSVRDASSNPVGRRGLHRVGHRPARHRRGRRHRQGLRRPGSARPVPDRAHRRRRATLLVERGPRVRDQHRAPSALPAGSTPSCRARRSGSTR